MQLKKPSLVVIILFAILLLGGLLRVYGLKSTPPGLYPDEAVNGNNIIEATHTGNYKVFYPENGGREGLFINIQALSYKIFQQNEPWVLRFPSTLIGTLTILGLFFLLQALALKAGWKHASALALIGAFLIATSVWHIIFSRIGLRVIMAPCIAVWGSFLTIKAIEHTSRKWAVTAGVVIALGFYTYTSFRIFPLALLALFPLFRKKSEVFALIFLTGLVCLLPLAWYFLQNPTDFSSHAMGLSVFNTPQPWTNLWQNIVGTAQMFHIQGDLNWRHNISGNPELFWPVGIFFALGMLVGFLRRTIFDGFFFAWLVVAAIPVVLAYPGVPHALRSLLIAPAVFAFSASGAYWLYEQTKKHLSQLHYGIAIIILSVILTGQAAVAYFLVWAPSPDVAYAFTSHYKTIADQVNALPIATPKTVVESYGDLSLCYPEICVQPVMFLTNSYLPEQQLAKHITYLTIDQYEKQKESLTGSVFFLN